MSVLPIPLVFLAAGAAGVFALSVFGLRGLLDIRDALRHAELDALVGAGTLAGHARCGWAVSRRCRC